jgi:predicted dehydrogenase
MPKKKYALVGTGSRAGMFLDALTGPWRDNSELVALCDQSLIRMQWHRDRLAGRGASPALYPAAQFERMIRETRPDVVIVTTIDSEHDHYLILAMELGCDVITEKPLTTSADKARAIFAAQERTGRNLRVAFNYRYAPAYTRFRELIHGGEIGRPLSVDFSWLLDTSHGADYFRRWHREKEHSGGLLVHKATHHFDLVNWWLGSWPEEVTALGDLLFYGRANAEARGEQYSYERYTGVDAARHDPFALDLTSKAAFEGLYLAAEAETGYLRDRNVFGDNITIEDTMSVSVRYQSRAILSYSLIAYSPWEGLRVAVTGTRGRAELEITESIDHLAGDGKAASVGASKGPFKQARMRLHRTFGDSVELNVPSGEGGHGGADPLMLEQLFSPDPPADPHGREASHVDGAASILVGIAANESLRSGRLVRIEELFPLKHHTRARSVPV